jgi:hypothetical protein
MSALCRIDADQDRYRPSKNRLSQDAAPARWLGMTEQLALIHVCDQVWGSVRPRAATAHITLTGSKLFSDRSALTKSEELRRLVEALRERGLPGDAVGLEGATLDVSTGLFTRSSSVTYRVSVRVEDLEKLPGLLETVATAKQATLTHIQWDYAGGASDDLIAQCATRAVAKAKHLAATLGVALGALHEVNEEELGEHAPHAQARYPVMLAAKGGGGMARMSDDFAGLELAPAKQVGVRVRLAYRVRTAAAT